MAAMVGQDTRKLDLDNSRGLDFPLLPMPRKQQFTAITVWSSSKIKVDKPWHYGD
jgi:hypothetical protein